MLERARQIKDIQRQVRFEIHPKIKTEEGVIINKSEYVADFVYYDILAKKKVIEDVKGYSTKEFNRKWRQMQERYSKEYYFLLS